MRDFINRPPNRRQVIFKIFWNYASKEDNADVNNYPAVIEYLTGKHRGKTIHFLIHKFNNEILITPTVVKSFKIITIERSSVPEEVNIIIFP